MACFFIIILCSFKTIDRAHSTNVMHCDAHDTYQVRNTHEVDVAFEFMCAEYHDSALIHIYVCVRVCVVRMTSQLKGLDGMIHI